MVLGVLFPSGGIRSTMYRRVEWDKVALGIFFPSGWDLMDCVGGLLECQP